MESELVLTVILAYSLNFGETLHNINPSYSNVRGVLLLLSLFLRLIRVCSQVSAVVVLVAFCRENEWKFYLVLSQRTKTKHS